MKRLFFALWPEQVAREQCLAVLERLPQDQLKAVASHNLHVTLQFLGMVAEEQLAELITAAEQISFNDISLSFDQLHYWQKPAVLCLSPSQTCAEIIELSTKIAAIARDTGIKLDERPYKPHITLARKAQRAYDVKFEPVFWQSRSFCLVESVTM